MPINSPHVDSAGDTVPADSRLDRTSVPDYAGLLRLDGDVAFVAGAGQGMGRQMAHALAQNGARVVCADNDPERAVAVAEEVDGTPLVADLLQRDEVARAVRSCVEDLGRIDHVVDIIGMAKWGQILDTTPEDYVWTFDMVLGHAWALAQLAGQAMADQAPNPRSGLRGTFTYVASVSAATGAPNHAVYGAAKAGLISLVKSMAVELGPRGIRTNAIAPGATWTPRLSAMLGPEGRAQNDENSPLGRMAIPADMAGPLLFLVSGLAGYINGQTITVDSGIGVKYPYPSGRFKSEWPYKTFTGPKDSGS